jgi:hypothetical protein
MARFSVTWTGQARTYGVYSVHGLTYGHVTQVQSHLDWPAGPAWYTQCLACYVARFSPLACTRFSYSVAGPTWHTSASDYGATYTAHSGADSSPLTVTNLHHVCCISYQHMALLTGLAESGLLCGHVQLLAYGLASNGHVNMVHIHLAVQWLVVRTWE